ncbi:MAG: ATP-binding protein [Planctomycetaceae bacterium]|nr:ATP-binding protein [Planctomycetota bacterium]NUN51457.1 ATP-binding protein [Planctomycetaceae bacterium]
MLKTLPRQAEIGAIRTLLRRNPVVALLGARQVGKSTLAREVAALHGGPVHHFDLEDPEVLVRFQEPMLLLRRLRGLVVLDEVQRTPEIFPVLRVLADRPGTPARFLVLGSAAPELLRQSTESLAGRIALRVLGGFGLDEVGAPAMEDLWVRGGFPRSFLAEDAGASLAWRRDFIRGFLERDLPGLGIRAPRETMGRFATMLAHFHGQTWNSSEFARAFGVSDHTVRRYLDLLTGTFVVERLRPWSENVGKRVVRSPRVFLADTGVLHALLGLGTLEDVESHPKVGASWEGFAASAVRRRLGAHPEECWFWGTQSGAELDLLVVRGRRRLGFEMKRTAVPRTTRSMHIAREDLRLDSLTVLHAGPETFDLPGGIRAMALSRVLVDLEPLPR